MGDLDREARIKQEAADKKRLDEELLRQAEEQERKRQEVEMEAKRITEEQAKQQQQKMSEAQPQHDVPAVADPPEVEKQLRKRSDPEDGNTPAQAPVVDVHAPPAPRAEYPPHAEAQAPYQPAAAAVPIPVPEEPITYTLCSPQLLHMDTDNTPLWFNGWLLDNKFANKHNKKFGSFKHYLIEPKEVREPGAWQLHENNECCLTTDEDKKYEFTAKEVKLLERMMQKAREVGAPGA